MKPEPTHKPAPKPAPKPPPQLSPQAIKKFAPPSDLEEKKPAAKPTENSTGLSLRGPIGNTTNNNPFVHILQWVLVTYSGFPAIFYYFTTGNPRKPFGSSWCEKVLRDLVKNADVRLSSFGLCQKIYDLYINGEVQKNSNGYPIKVFLILLEKPATPQQASQAGQGICNVVNEDTKSKPLAIVRETPSPYHPENAVFQDMMGNEQPLGILSDHIGNPSTIPDCYTLYEELIRSLWRMATLCRTLASIIGAPLEWVHPEYLSAEERNFIRLANEEFFSEPFSIDNNFAGDAAPPADDDAMEEEDDDNRADGGSANNTDNHSLADGDGDDNYAEHGDFIVNDHEDDDPDGTYHYDDDDEEEEEEEDLDDDDDL